MSRLCFKCEVVDAHLDTGATSATAVELCDVHRGAEVVRANLERLLSALARCEGHLGAFSCVEPHDARCLKARAAPPPREAMTGNWRCTCGRDELDQAVKEAREA